jgi:hypothetical protein
MIQYAALSQFFRKCLGILDARFRVHDDEIVEVIWVT